MLATVLTAILDFVIAMILFIIAWLTQFSGTYNFPKTVNST